MVPQRIRRIFFLLLLLAGVPGAAVAVAGEPRAVAAEPVAAAERLHGTWVMDFQALFDEGPQDNQRRQQVAALIRHSGMELRFTPGGEVMRSSTVEGRSERATGHWTLLGAEDTRLVVSVVLGAPERGLAQAERWEIRFRDADAIQLRLNDGQELFFKRLNA